MTRPIRAIVGALLCALACSKSASPSLSDSGAQPAPSAASARSNRTTDPTAEEYPTPQLPRARIILKDAYGGAHAVDAEVAATEEMTTRGLMWRTQLPDGKGMLFIFPDEKVRSFWMRNTLIPLDMIFISQAKRIVGIVAQAAPRTLTSRSVGVPSKYVLEVPGGWSEKSGIESGSQVEIETR